MTTVNEFLAEYAADHQNPVNKRLHKICVPAIVVSLLGLLWSIPVPGLGSDRPFFLNWAIIAALFALLWYLWLSPRFALGMAVGTIAALAIVSALDGLETPLWLISAGIFIVAWIGQFVGHGFEGKRPSFLRDLRFLLIGPLWVLSSLYRLLGIRA